MQSFWAGTVWHHNVACVILWCHTVWQWSIEHMIMLNVTWRRFDQSAKQLIVGRTTITSLPWVIHPYDVACSLITVGIFVVCSRSHCGRWCSRRSSSMLSGHLKNASSNSMRNSPQSGGLISKDFRVLWGYVPHCSGHSVLVPSVLWRCWLGGRKGIQPVKNWVVGCWHGYLSGVRCRLAYSPADATAAHCFLLQWNPDWFYLSGTGWPG